MIFWLKESASWLQWAADETRLWAEMWEELFEEWKQPTSKGK